MRPTALIFLFGLLTVQSLLLTIVRHGETEWNAVGRLQGSSDSPLTEKGVSQATLCGQRLRDQKFAAAYCSPLPRARRTAELMLEQLEAPPQLEEADTLRERAFGFWEGMVWEDIERLYSDQLAQSRSNADYAIPGGGESRNFNLENVLSFLKDVAERHPRSCRKDTPPDEEESVLCVTHSATATALIKEVLGLPQASRRSFEVRNLALNVLRFDGRNWKLATLGDVAHLEATDSMPYFGGTQNKNGKARM